MATRKKKLIIVESPAKARTVSRFLGSGYKVEASQGHVCDLPKSQIGVDADNDFEPKYITIRGRGDILARIRKEAKNASQIYLATDPDREGEAISWHLANILGIDKDAPCRIEFHEITKTAVQHAIKAPRSIDMGRVDAQQARRVLDRLVGYKISPLLWVKIKKGLSAGRVQSVAARMVVSREKEIEAFIPEEFWDVTAKGTSTASTGKKETYPLRLISVNGKRAPLADGETAAQAVADIGKGTFTAGEIKRGQKRKMPAPPFTTSSLQQEAGRKLNFSTAKTMQVVQQLYEGVDLEHEGTQGLVTYIRTDSVRVSDEALASLRAMIPVRYGAEYLPEEPLQYKGRANAQDAHEAIRPTSIERTPESVKDSLTKEQFNLYRLIYNRFVASQMMPALYESMSAEIQSGDIVLRFSGDHKIFAGFTAVYEEGSDDSEAAPDSHIPDLAAGQTVQVTDVRAEQHFTQPPSRYTEASLVKAMEEKGIGRPSTYAPTITTILSRGYVSKEKKRLFPTELGRMVNSLMEQYFPDIVNTDFTASLESQLDDVEEGKRYWKEIIREFYPPFARDLEIAEGEIDRIEVKDEESDVPCDKCGAMMVYKMGRFGKFLACPNFPECRNAKPILTYIDAPCPKCGARLMVKVSNRVHRKFYGCERYPDCDFVCWEQPVDRKCDKCGSYMVLKIGSKGERWYLCANENCRSRIEAPHQEDENE
ncbi:MAG: type I DNA topoisomerase [Clostridia bacterium]|nr:type I DNA topoisomerase [Clostridia bacterium]MBR4459147.1 type I DNA topoisomerase [Clostridia bacterium]